MDKTEGSQRFLLLQESGILLFVTDQGLEFGLRQGTSNLHPKFLDSYQKTIKRRKLFATRDSQTR